MKHNRQLEIDMQGIVKQTIDNSSSTLPVDRAHLLTVIGQLDDSKVRASKTVSTLDTQGISIRP